jgi:hypothetical protein
MIHQDSDVQSFFRERLDGALSRQSLRLSSAAKVYVVNLMAGFANGGFGSALDEPFALRLAAALRTRGGERARLLRELGDTALYACGFFSEHLERRGISREYIVTMGYRGYRGAVDAAPRSALAAVCPELAFSFDPLARVLDDVRESTALRTPQQIVRLYERWHRTRSPLLAERLEAEGVYPLWNADVSTTIH